MKLELFESVPSHTSPQKMPIYEEEWQANSHELTGYLQIHTEQSESNRDKLRALANNLV